MFSNVSSQITNKLLENRIIDEENKSIYLFAVQQTLIMSMNILTALLLGCIFQLIEFVILFIASFIPLRIYAGGIHAKTPLRCYMYSMIILIILLLVIKYFNLSLITYITVFVISSILILYFAPIEDPNKPLDNHEKSVYKSRAIKIWVIEAIVFSIGTLLEIQIILSSFISTMFSIAILVILGKIKKKYHLHS